MSFKLDLAREVDGDWGNREDLWAAGIIGTNGTKPMKCPKRIRAFFSKKVTCLTGHLKCFYTNACSMDNKQKECS